MGERDRLIIGHIMCVEVGGSWARDRVIVTGVVNRWQTIVTAHTSRYSVLNYLFTN